MSRKTLLPLQRTLSASAAPDIKGWGELDASLGLDGEFIASVDSVDGPGALEHLFLEHHSLLHTVVAPCMPDLLSHYNTS